MTCADWKLLVDLAREGYVLADEAVRWEAMGDPSAAEAARSRETRKAVELNDRLAQLLPLEVLIQEVLASAPREGFEGQLARDLATVLGKER